MEKKIDSSVLLWVFFVSKGIKDNTDLMRCQMLCMVCNEPNATTMKIVDCIFLESKDYTRHKQIILFILQVEI